MHSLSLFLFRSNCTSSHERNLRWKMNSSQVWTKYNLNSTTVFLNESPWNCFVFEKWKRKGKREGFFVHANWPIAFFKGQTTHPFLSSPPFIRSTLPSFLLSPLASRILAESTLQGKGGRNERRRNGGYQMYGNKEEAGLNSGEWTLLSKGNVDGIPPPAVHGRAGHFSLRSPLSYGYSFRLPFDSQIARNNRYFPDIERSFYYPPRLMIAQLL